MKNSRLYDMWQENMDSFYEAKYKEPVIEALCQYHGGSVDGRDGKGKIFNAGYEVFIFAFFLGLYIGERNPVQTPKLKFRMKMCEWGRKSTERGRKSYTSIQEYIFAALVAKTDINLIDLDKDCTDEKLEEACNELMTTLNEYANTGFRFLLPDTSKPLNPAYFENDGLLNLIRNFTGK